MNIARIVATGTSLGLIALLSFPAAAMVLKFHHDLPEDSAQHVAAEQFAKIVNERTDGVITVQIFPNNTLADDVQAVQQMQFGAIEGGIIPTAKLANFAPAMQAVDLPFLFPSAEIAHKVLDGEVGDQLLATLDQIGLVGAGFWESGFKQFTCNAPVESAKDFQGRSVRVMESPLIIEQFRALGANPVPIAFSETYTALQQGVVDCQENPLVSIVQMKFHEVQDHVILSDHAYLGYAVVFSKSWLEGLPEEHQKVITDTIAEVTEFQREETARREDGYIATIEESRAALTRLDDAGRTSFEEAVAPVHERFSDEIGAELLEATYQEIKEISSGT